MCPRCFFWWTGSWNNLCSRDSLFRKSFLSSRTLSVEPFFILCGWNCSLSSQKHPYCKSWVLMLLLKWFSQFIFRYTGERVSFPAFPLMNLLPTDKTKYFRYPGSLTTPPCSEAVTWTVFKDPIEISQAQVKFKKYHYSQWWKWWLWLEINWDEDY